MDAGITPQQAALLLPLLQQIANGNQPMSSPSPGASGQSSSGCSSSGSSPPFFVPAPAVVSLSSRENSGYSTDGSKSVCKFSSDELFQRKRKNSKSSSAHSFCHISLLLVHACLVMFG